VPTYRLTLEYEGTRYSGWQEQTNARTVMGELRRAVEEAAGERADLGGSGRTDAGVHALAQVAHLRLRRPLDPVALRASVNGRLPQDIHVLSLDPAPGRFHARHDATSRTYLYQIATRRTAFAKRFVWWVRRPLDPARMADAAALIVGRHDFQLLCERPEEQASTLVVVERAQVAVDGALVLVRLTASHFLWRMVRRLVGVLVQIGDGRLAPRDLDALLLGRPLPPGRGRPAEWTAPASGLFLEHVAYPGEPVPDGPWAAIPVPAEPARSAGKGAPARSTRLR
jgi:tRNA pseudouridine38-40 synthase